MAATATALSWQQPLTRAQLKEVLDLIGEAVIVLDAEGRIALGNPAAARLLGLEDNIDLAAGYAQVAGQFELCTLEGRPLTLAERPISAVQRGETVRDLHVLRRRKRDGGIDYLSLSALPLYDVRGVQTLSVLVARDVTAEHEAERARGETVTAREQAEEALRRSNEQLRQSQKLESIGRLAGGVAHDFNNLLTVILSCVEQLEQELRTSGTVSGSEIAEVHAAGKRAAELTRQLLAFARKQVLAPVPVSLDAVLLRSERLLARVLGEDLQLVVLPGSDPWAVLADPSQLDQVLLNLAVNARDAMPGGGTLTIRTGREEAEGPGGPEEWVCLRVCDTGAGMPPEVQAHLFEPFFTTKPPGRGTGLGLATVHGIVTQSGGQIRVESAAGCGTTFHLRFPRTPRTPLAPPSASPEQPAAAPPPTGTILLVEDDPQVRAISARALQGAGYGVLVAPDGDAALALSEAHDGPVDLVVCDVVMPGQNGRLVVEALRRTRPALRALFVSGHSHDAISERGVLDSGVQFLAKPFTASLLLARVREVLL